MEGNSFNDSFTPLLSSSAEMNKVENTLSQLVVDHKTVKVLVTSPKAKQFRGVLSVTPELQHSHLTLGALAGQGKISVPPFVFTDEERGSLLAFYHLGSQLAGHAGLCHGGLLAVLLDECMGRACFPLLLNKIAVTAKLDINYCVPIPLDSFILVKVETEEVIGRKAWTKAVIEDPVTGIIFIEANALFIEPKWAAEMSKVI